ncbi:glyceraldehyde-3-phosphate dehydrogenase [Alphaproteobacteria bacterium KMM 3653]|uniref:Glyceraldehyde-3-phosphate dehydrogenase n=1 Tax=Harenicola maris TaxID=2841044 RepID=A0AAP2CR21_9RHOB|nr:glyceraldehyde-3-phosphate dehydrogenase [Harenicola maris]
MARPLRIAINGFGRIGRTLLRQYLTTDLGEGFEIVLINDIAEPETSAYLFAYDSIYGPFGLPVEAENGRLKVGAWSARLTHAHDLSEINLRDVDMVFECTGKARGRDFASAGLRSGAERVLISGPSDAADVTAVMGCNEAEAVGGEVVSNASCTTNALGPLLKVIDRNFQITSGHMTTIHCYTGSQPTVDAPRGPDLVRNRAAALSMVPTSTSAGGQVDKVLPHLAGVVTSRAVRVPTASVSSIDLSFVAKRAPKLESLGAALREAAPLIGWTDAPLVSSDLRGRAESLVIAGPEMMVQPGGMARVFGWYDNEWGFSARMYDMARVMTG